MEKDVEEAESIPLRNIGKHSEAEHVEEEVKERPSTMRQLFDQFDIDHTGNISILELRSIINSGQHNFPEGVVRRIMQLADQDNSGHLDFEEFSTMIHHPELKQVFGRFVQKYVGFVVPPRHYTGAVTISRLSASDGKYKQEYSWWPPPVVMVLVSLLQITLYLVDELFFSDLKENGGAPVATWLLYSPYKRQEAWRFVTYMFVHLRLGHLIMNLLVQILIGIPLQMVHHWWRVLLVYGAGVLAGSLATSVFSPTDALVGASGGVFALYVANISSIVLNWSEMKHPLVSLMVFILYFAGDIGANVMNRYPIEKPGNVGYTAHLAGVLAGLLVGIGVLRNLEVKSWENILWWVAVTLFLLLVSAAICINVFWPGRFLDTRYLS